LTKLVFLTVTLQQLAITLGKVVRRTTAVGPFDVSRNRACTLASFLGRRRSQQEIAGSVLAQLDLDSSAQA